MTTSPPFAFRTQLAGDGHFIHVVPDGFLRPDTRYSVRVAGGWEGDGARDRWTARSASARLRCAAGARRSRPGRAGCPRSSSAAWPCRCPPIVPSLNQIGFDSYDMVVGALEVSKPDASGEGSLLLWAVSTRRGPGGVPVADRRGAFSFPLAGRYRDDSVIVSQRGLNLTFSFGDVPLRRFELRMQLDGRLRSRGGAALYVEVSCPDVPVYGPAFIAIGLCNEDLTLPASGTFVTGRYPAAGPANRRPAGRERGEPRAAPAERRRGR